MREQTIASLVREYAANPRADAVMRAFLARCVQSGLTLEETADLTVAMARTGTLLNWQMAECAGKVSVDLPSTGGIGNKTPILAPLLALAAAPERIFVPKLSSRGRVAGTIDILEAIGYRAEMPLAAYQAIVRKVGIGNLAQTPDLAPVDKELMELRKVVGAMEQAHLVVSSVLCKKLASGCRNIVIDVKAGPDSKFGDLDQTLGGARLFLQVGRILRAQGYIDNLRAVVTNNYELQGRAHGRLVALQEVMDTLQGNGPYDLEHLSVSLAARLLVTAGVAPLLREAETMIRNALTNGNAYAKGVEYLRAHGAELKRLKTLARYQIPLHASAKGKIWQIEVRLINDLCWELQATKGAQYTAGIVLEEQVQVGMTVALGDLLATVYAEDKESGERVAARLASAFPLYHGELEVTPKPLILAECWLEDDEIREDVAWQRVSRSALAIIRRERHRRPEYLFRYNRKWRAWNLLAGHFEPEKDRDFHDAMIREFIEEVGEEVGEPAPVWDHDFTVEPWGQPALIDLSFSAAAKQWTKYEFHCFRVELKGETSRWEGLWQRHPETFRWFTREELAAGVSADGKAVLTPFPLGSLLSTLA